MMRLPLKSNDPTDYDYELLIEMVDNFLAAGYTYFDTSYIYHNGKSEDAYLDFFGALPEEKVILANGTDATELVRKAKQWLIENSF